jgi:NAD(P)-dependent dehydrogenase (short-subunit alcohol dehydrogenase family)
MGVRNVVAGQRTADQWQLGDLIRVLALDLTDAAGMDAAAGWVDRQLGGASVLVNNAAVYLDGEESILQVGGDLVNQTIRTNFLGPWAAIRAFGPQVVRAGSAGRIVNVSSAGGEVARTFGAGAGPLTAPSYTISKLALNALTVGLARELAEVGTRVNAVCPGWVRTEMGGASAHRSVAEGADTPVWLATLPDTGPTGGFFRDRKQIEW